MNKIESVLRVPDKDPEKKLMKGEKRNWLAILWGVLVFALIALAAIPITKIVQPVMDRSVLRKELRNAERCSVYGFHRQMETHLIKAQWEAEERGVNIDERVKKIYAKGIDSIIKGALSSAIYGHAQSAKYGLTKYREFCLRAEIQPHDQKIAEIEAIINKANP